MSRHLCRALLLGVCSLCINACGSGASLEPPCHAAQLRITEIMVNPVGPAAPAWVEVHNPSAEAAVLEGLTLAVLTGKRRRAVALQTPRVLAPGERWVLGQGDEAASPVHHAYGAGLPLSKKRATLRVECGERLVDAVTYGEGGVPEPELGMSLQRVGDCWCHSPGRRYDGLNVGTPGQRKAACPAHACGAPSEASAAP